jgi:glucose-6-phosphate dehydrogenase assembly protein OpcA
MSTTIEAGLPVEIGRIDKELGKLWEESGDTKTRASLINLAIFTDKVEKVNANTALISEIAAEHACRAILIFANPDAPEPAARAWISAHCHLAGKGERQICSEQITFQLDGDMLTALPSIVFSHLDSDLPLYFWRQGEFRKPLNEKLWSRVDRLIYDSADWRNPVEQFAIVKEIGTFTETRTILCDLNWTRLLGTRFALAQLFDHSCVLARTTRIRRVSISSSTRLAGLLLLGWLAAQLGWSHQSLLGKESFVSKDGQAIEFEITETPGEAISRCAFESGDATFEITREEGSAYYHAKVCGGDSCETPMLVPAGRSKLTDILLMELSRGGKHPLYSKALAAIAPLL